LEDRVLLGDWETDLMNNFFSYVYDRRFIDQDVFRRLQAQGEIIKMAIKIEDLNKDGGFWKEEEQIT
jgi:hypothetical protein